MTAAAKSKFARFVAFARLATLALSATLCGFVAWSYYLRPDSVAAATVFPIWAWLIPGGLLAGSGAARGSRLYAAIVLAAWLVVLVRFSDEPFALLRFGASASDDRSRASQGNRIRVISLNCGGGNVGAVEELAAYRPDLVLLQESPSRSQLEQAAQKLFGDEGAVVWSADASIIARGKLSPRPLSRLAAAHAVCARWQIEPGVECDVVSLRLEPGLARCDLWTADCWRAQTDNRRKRRGQLAAIVEEIRFESTAGGLIIGGDFNAPAGDAIFRLLSPSFRDTFSTAGRGWGNTIVNDFPALRIDQIWTTAAIIATDAVAVRTQNSDHRGVVCDLLLRQGEQR